VSLFTTWRRPGIIELLWLKERPAGPDFTTEPSTQLFGAGLADGPRHPIPGAPTLYTTAQQGEPGPWFERLPHFRLEFTPSAGEELQSEYLVSRVVAAEAIAALGAIRERFAHLVQISEFRSVAADDLWLSPAFGRDSIGIHFTWVKDVDAVTAVLPEVEAALAPFEPRPHWGKVFVTAPDDVIARYPRWAEFAELRKRFDPDDVLLNDMLTPYFS
jgi:xylitol oxidase